VFYYHNDHLGTPQVMTDITGNIVWKADYEPFGKVNIVVGNIENNIRFPGQYYISETGLYYNWWRWYKSETGRYMEKDLALFLFPNYLYANNNPLFYKDLKGLYNTEGEKRCGVIVYIVCRISFVSLCILACAATESPPLCDTICKRVVGPEICIPIKISICKLYCPPQKPEDDKRPKPDKKPSCIK
jgi:RHS repeat-associated protein